MKIELYATAKRDSTLLAVEFTVKDVQAHNGMEINELFSPAERLNLLHRVAARMQEVAEEELSAALGQLALEQ